MITSDLNLLAGPAARGDFGVQNPKNAWPGAGRDITLYWNWTPAGEIVQTGFTNGDPNNAWRRVRSAIGLWGPWEQLGAPVVPGTYVLLAGDRMTGMLELPGDPMIPLHAATKAYVDARASLPTGGTVGQALVINAANNPQWGAPIDGGNY